MKKFLLKAGSLFLFTFLTIYTIKAQNPNWTLPGQYFEPVSNNVLSLPTLPGSYQGAASIGLHNSYSDNNGNILFFNVDEAVYDKTGYHVGDLQSNINKKKRGYNESLILPMGKSCTRFAFLYFGSIDYNSSGFESYTTSGRVGFFMSVYDMDAINLYDPDAIGSLDGMGIYSNYNTAVDISKRDGTDFSINTLDGNDLYGYSTFINGSDTLSGSQQYIKQFQIASTKVIDNCYYYVFVSDGENLIRYKLDESGLIFDNYLYDIGVSSTNFVNRTEMEMVELANGNYRIALPLSDLSAPKNQIKIYDLDSNFEVVSTQSIPLGSDVNGISSFPIGLEFDPTGRYLYFTHNPNVNLPNVLEVWDVNSNAYSSGVTLPAGISDFQYSYIERYGNKLYLAKSDKIGELSNISNPGSINFNLNAANITSGYGNNLVNNNPPTFPNDNFFRYILPDQVDDGDYGDLADRSCDCCARFNSARDVVEVYTDATWTPANNPLTNGGSDVYISNELRIKAGTNLNIENMNFFFAPNAKVVIEKGDVNNNGAKLYIKDNTVFTADTRCNYNVISSCGQTDPPCEKNYWTGVIVEGDPLLAQPVGSTTKQGQFSMRYNAMIEYAKEAILAKGGSVVKIISSRLKDNLKGATFESYISSSGGTEIFNRSFISNSEFTITDNYFENDPMKWFVKTTNFSGMYISGNHFANLISSSGFIGKGIYSVNSRLIIQPHNPTQTQSEFENLYYGVYGISTSKNVRQIYINYNIFNNNFKGVFLDNLLNPIVLDNEFNIPAAISATGLHLTATTGYVIENNYFQTFNNQAYNRRNIGIYVQSSGPFYNEIYRNFFTRLSFGGRVVKQNVNYGNNGENELGLDWLCNQFDAPLHYSDLSLGSNGSMSDEQGECQPEPAGNLFSHSSLSWNSSHFDLFSEVGAITPIDYNHHGNTAAYPRLIPVQYSGQGGGTPAYQLQPCYKSYGSNTCPIKRSGIPNWGDGPSNGGPKSLSANISFESIYDQAISYAENMEELQNLDTGVSEYLNDEISVLNSEIREFWHDVTMFYQMDTLSVISLDQMTLLLNEFQPTSNDRFAAAFLENNSQEWFSEYVNYGSIEIAQPIAENGTLPIEIPTYFEGVFFDNLGNVDALNSYYIENDSYYNPSLDMPDWSLFNESDELPDGSKSGKDVGLLDEESTDIRIIPNPFKDNVTFNLKAYKFDGIGNRIEFYDLLGKKVHEEMINENQVNAIIQGNKLPEGIILFTLFVNNSPVENGKIIRVK